MKIPNQPQQTKPLAALTRVVLALSTAAMVLVAAPAAFAQDGLEAPMCNDGCVPKKDVCALACKAERHACVHAAQVDYARCQADCRTGSDSREEFKRCSYECKHEFRVAKARCKVNGPVCNGVCRRPSKDEVCVKDCAADLRECVSDVHEKGRHCAEECRDLPKDLQGPCLRGCYSLTKGGARECWDGFTGCVHDCPKTAIDGNDATE